MGTCGGLKKKRNVLTEDDSMWSLKEGKKNKKKKTLKGWENKWMRIKESFKKCW